MINKNLFRLWITEDHYFCLFGEREVEQEEEDDEEEQELELESERYLLLSRPLITGLGGGVGRVHGPILS